MLQADVAAGGARFEPLDGCETWCHRRHAQAAKAAHNAAVGETLPLELEATQQLASQQQLTAPGCHIGEAACNEENEVGGGEEGAGRFKTEVADSDAEADAGRDASADEVSPVVTPAQLPGASIPPAPSAVARRAAQNILAKLAADGEIGGGDVTASEQEAAPLQQAALDTAPPAPPTAQPASGTTTPLSTMKTKHTTLNGDWAIAAAADEIASEAPSFVPGISGGFSLGDVDVSSPDHEPQAGAVQEHTSAERCLSAAVDEAQPPGGLDDAKAVDDAARDAMTAGEEKMRVVFAASPSTRSPSQPTLPTAAPAPAKSTGTAFEAPTMMEEEEDAPATDEDGGVTIEAPSASITASKKSAPAAADDGDDPYALPASMSSEEDEGNGFYVVASGVDGSDMCGVQDMATKEDAAPDGLVAVRSRPLRASAAANRHAQPPSLMLDALAAAAAIAEPDNAKLHTRGGKQRSRGRKRGGGGGGGGGAPQRKKQQKSTGGGGSAWPKWEAGNESKSGKVFYAACQVSSAMAKIAVGSFVYLLPERPSDPMMVAKVEALFVKPDESGWVKVRWFARPADMHAYGHLDALAEGGGGGRMERQPANKAKVARDTGTNARAAELPPAEAALAFDDEYELILLDWTDDVPIQSVEGPVTVLDEDAFVQAQEEAEEDSSLEDTFFCHWVFVSAKKKQKARLRPLKEGELTAVCTFGAPK